MSDDAQPKEPPIPSKYPRRLFVGDPELNGKFNEGDADEGCSAYTDLDSIVEQGNEQDIAIYVLEKIVKAKNETTVIE